MPNEMVRATAELITAEKSVSAAADAFLRAANADLIHRLRAALRAAAAVHLVDEPPLELSDGWENDLTDPEVLARLEAAGVYVRRPDRRIAKELAQGELSRRAALAALRDELAPIAPHGEAGLDLSLECFPELGPVSVRVATRMDRELPGLPLPTEPGLGTLDLLLNGVFPQAGPLGARTANPALLEERFAAINADAHFAPLGDPAWVAELLATIETLGGVPVIDGASIQGSNEEALEAVSAALEGAVLWRSSAVVTTEGELGDAWTDQIVIDHGPVRWSSDVQGVGVLLMVMGDGLTSLGEALGSPVAHHTFVLVCLPDLDDPERIGSLYRVITSCPGTGVCLRGGCAAVEMPVLEAAYRRRAVARVAAAATAIAGPAWHGRMLAGRAFREEHDLIEGVSDLVQVALGQAGWAPLQVSTWDGGLVEILARRGDQVLALEFDPVTRQIRARGDAARLELEADMLAEDGLLDEEGAVDRATACEHGWDSALLDAVVGAEAGRLRDAAVGHAQTRSLTLTALPIEAVDDWTVGEEPEFVVAAVIAFLMSLPGTGQI